MYDPLPIIDVSSPVTLCVCLQACAMSLQDCVAMACTYLDDAHLHTYITSLTADVVEKGDIRGLFLTGLTDSGIKLLTNFVNLVCVCVCVCVEREREREREVCLPAVRCCGQPGVVR